MLRAGHVIQLTVLALLGLAVVMVHSAELPVGGNLSVWELMLRSKHALYALIAAGAVLLAGRINVRYAMECRGVTNPVPWALLLALVLAVAALIPGIGVTINGARRWLRVAGVMFQPSEVLKWVIVLALALWCARRAGVMHRFRAGLMPPMLLVGVACALVVAADLGTAALIAFVALSLLLAGGARWWHLGLLVPTAAAGLGLALATSPYRRARLQSFLDPFADPQGKGYQAIQGLISIAQGGLTGRGLGNGIQKQGYLPADTSDFIFGVICSELGMFGAVLVISLYLVLIWSGMQVIQSSKDRFSRLLALGITLTVALQAMINLMVATVLAPTKGIPLPLLSAGGTGWIATAFALGLVAAVDHANHLDEIEASTPETDDSTPNQTPPAGEEILRAASIPGCQPTGHGLAV